MYFFFNRYLSAKALFIWVSEFILIISSAYVAILLSQSYMGSVNTSPELVAFNATLLAITYMTVFYLFDLYEPASYRVKRGLVVRIVQATVIANAVLAIVCYSLRIWNSWCWVLLANTAILPAALVTWRTILTKLLNFEFPRKKVLIIGSGELAKQIGQEVYNRSEEGFNLLGFIDNDPSRFRKSIVNPGVIGGYGDIANVVTDNNVSKVIIALSDRRAKLPMSALLACKLKGVMILDGGTYHEWLTGKIPLDRIKPNWLVFSGGFGSLKAKKIFKRLLDLIVSIIGFVITSPILVITALLIKLDSKGPIVTSHVRVGEQGKLFKMYKFRSMRHDMEKVTGPVWKKSNDDRVTKVGKIIMKVGIDALPSLINVISGEMSFVGPRPERPYFAEQVKKIVPYYEVRFVVKPGITGWAQIKYQYSTSPEDAMEKLQYDVYYVKNMSPLLDIKIIFRTIMILFGRIGDR